MAEEENETPPHGCSSSTRRRFGDHIPLIRREDVRGFIRRQAAVDGGAHSTSTRCAQRAASMEAEAANFYRRARGPQRPTPAVRKLLGDLADIEAAPRDLARAAAKPASPKSRTGGGARDRPAQLRAADRPTRPGRPDGRLGVDAGARCSPPPSPPTTAGTTFLVGMAASLGAGISMGFAEALSDDGTLTGRGHPLDARPRHRLDDHRRRRRPHPPLPDPAISGIATTLAIVVVLVELWAIA